jgi:hypothetical protein
MRILVVSLAIFLAIGSAANNFDNSHDSGWDQFVHEEHCQADRPIQMATGLNEELIYLVSRSGSHWFVSTQSSFESFEASGGSTVARLSPNTLRLGWLGSDPTTGSPAFWVHAVNTNEQSLFSMEDEVVNFFWLNEFNVLTSLSPLFETYEFYPYERLNVINGLRSFVFPESWNTDQFTQPFFPDDSYPGLFELSPDGSFALKMLRNGQVSIYETSTSNLIRKFDENFYGHFAWGQGNFVFLSRTGDQNSLRIMEYSIVADELRPIVTLPDAEPGQIYLESTSLSPDGRYLALKRAFSLMGQNIVILDLASGVAIDTCFVNVHDEQSSLSVDFRWSQDSQYLAFLGSQNDTSSNDSLYVYDVSNHEATIVYQGLAKIVGWLLDS